MRNITNYQDRPVISRSSLDAISKGGIGKMSLHYPDVKIKYLEKSAMAEITLFEKCKLVLLPSSEASEVFHRLKT